MNELLGVYDKEGNYLNKTIIRGRKDLRQGEYILIALVFIKNQNDEYLIQKTSINKAHEFTTTAGHVTNGEEPLESIVREVKEELGYSTRSEAYTLIDKIILAGHHCIYHIYHLEMTETDLNKFSIQKSEVESICWLKKEEVLTLINNKEFSYKQGLMFKMVLGKI